jgi:undecaprenyl diphosphate synthase
MHEQAGRPFHVGIIMDGNGRWAKARGLGRIAGHLEGARRVTGIVKAAPDLGVTHLTLFAFSTENWRRPLAEVAGLMRIFRQYIVAKTEDLRAHGVRVRFIGMRHRLPEHLQRLMAMMEDRTASCAGLRLTIAIDYGGRDEIARTITGLAEAVAAGELAPEAIDEAALAGRLDTAGLPDPDLIIRTSGEQRVSNFLLWQGVYAEYAFPAIPWPEFDIAAFAEAVAAFSGRERRFGAVAAPALSAEAARR